MKSENKEWALIMLKAIQSVLEREEDDFRTDKGLGEKLETLIAEFEDEADVDRKSE